jgi:hypothetical protein
MDANAFYEQKLSPEAALEELLELYKSIRSVNGTMITIWHNNFLGSDEAFAGWKEVYARICGSGEQSIVDSPWFIVRRLISGSLLHGRPVHEVHSV